MSTDERVALDVEAIREWWRRPTTEGIWDTAHAEEVANQAVDDVPRLLAALEEAGAERDEAVRLLGELCAAVEEDGFTTGWAEETKRSYTVIPNHIKPGLMIVKIASEGMRFRRALHPEHREAKE